VLNGAGHSQWAIQRFSRKTIPSRRQNCVGLKGTFPKLSSVYLLIYNIAEIAQIKNEIMTNKKILNYEYRQIKRMCIMTKKINCRSGKILPIADCHILLQYVRP
jgi:hypothetical protein